MLSLREERGKAIAENEASVKRIDDYSYKVLSQSGKGWYDLYLTEGDETAGKMLEANRIYYNFLRPHSALNGQTPAEKAGIDLGLQGNKWEELIRRAKRAGKSSYVHLKLEQCLSPLLGGTPPRRPMSILEVRPPEGPHGHAS